MEFKKRRRIAHQSDECLYRSTFEKAAVGIAHVALDGTWLRVNPALCEIVGYSPAELKTLRFQDLTFPEDLAVDLSYVEQLISGQIDHYMLEKRYVRKNGELVWGRLSVSLIRTHQGKPDYFISVVQDISGQKRAEEALVKAKKELEYRVNALPMMMGIVELAGNEIIHISDNPTTASYYGTTPEKMRRQLASDLGVPRSEIEFWIHYFRLSEKTQKPIQFDFEFVDQEKKRWGAATVNFMGTEDKNRSRFSYSVIDITDRKRSEERNKLLADATAALSVPLEDGDALGHFIRCCIPRLADACLIDIHIEFKKIKRIKVGHKDLEKEVILNTQLSKYPPRFDMSHPITTVMQTGKPSLIPKFDPEVLKRITYNQDHLDLVSGLNIQSIIVVPIRGRLGVLGAISFISTEPWRRYDTHDLKTAEELAWRVALVIENEDLYFKAREAIRLRDDFLSIVSHDLKSPLTSIRLNAQLIERNCLNENLNELATRVGGSIQHSVDVMVHLVDNLLDISKIDANRLIIEPTLVSAVDLIGKTLRVLHPLAQAKGISIFQKIHYLAPIVCDQFRIEQVLTNLVGNAIKFSPEGRTIEVGVEDAQTEVKFFVKDNGPGIAQENLEHVFERYWQSKENSKKGTGLGLYIAKGIVEIHGGRIGVESKLGFGSTFWFTLPLKPFKPESV